MSTFFIKRPVFAAVISIIILVLGAVSLLKLPVARYPDLAPPTIQISAVYPGADAKTVSETVAAVIEKEVNGVENMLYMSSISGNDGTMNLTVTFAPGTDLDTANVLVQSRVSRAEASLPEEVRRNGVTVAKRTTDIVMYLSLISPDGSYDANFLSNYSSIYLRDELARTDGVGDVTVFGVGEFSMRLWLDPDAMRARSLAAEEVLNAVGTQNVQVAAGRIGASPAPAGTAQEYVVSTQGRLKTTEEFENIIIKTNDDGSTVRLRDVARVELGSDSYSTSAQLNGAPSATIAIYQTPGSNLIEVANGVRAKMDELALKYPQGVEHTVVYDATTIVKSSIKEVIITLIATLILVVLTVYLFLQDFRATLIPTLTIPVSLIGTFGVMLALGLSLNILTLFGLVLVIGIVVDDAIIVVENTFVHLEAGKKGKDAAIAAMKEVSGPVVATTLVLLAVFVPTLAMGGITGTMFKQFSATIAIATVFSSICALTLSPALCGILLKKPEREPRGVFKLFNKLVSSTNKAYCGLVRTAVRLAFVSLIVFAAIIFISVKGIGSLPTGFVPQEDEGYCIVAVQLPDGATLERTEAVIAQIQQATAEIDDVADTLSISGFSLIDSAAAANNGFCIVTFKPWDQRPDASQHQSEIIAQIQQKLQAIPEANSFAFPVPSLPGVGISGGFTMMVQDRGGVGLEDLSQNTDQLIAEANQEPELSGVRTTFRPAIPQLYANIDQEQVMRTGTSMQAVHQVLQIYLGGAYINDFTLFGRVFKVNAQADAPFRDSPSDINALHLRGNDGQMIPLGAVASIEPKLGPQNVTRFNMMPSIKVQGNPSPGNSSGQAMASIAALADQTLPSSLGYAWSELSFQQQQASGGGIVATFALSILLVYLVLAAQYESWTLPISVVLAVPTALLGAYLAIQSRGYTLDIYTQIGLILLIAMATKTAILLTEFAALERSSGKSLLEAAVSAVRLRYRAVLMTALSFILGVIPLIIASGAGAESRKVLGTAVFGGMMANTLFSLLFVPVLYYIIQGISDKFSRKKPDPAAEHNQPERTKQG